MFFGCIYFDNGILYFLCGDKCYWIFFSKRSAVGVGGSWDCCDWLIWYVCWCSGDDWFVFCIYCLFVDGCYDFEYFRSVCVVLIWYCIEMFEIIDFYYIWLWYFGCLDYVLVCGFVDLFVFLVFGSVVLFVVFVVVFFFLFVCDVVLGLFDWYWLCKDGVLL